MKSALIIGASGLVGGHCLHALLATEYYSKVIALARKPLDIIHEKLEHYFVNFDSLAKFAPLIKADDIFCTLGTTIRKAGSQAAFEKVDYTYPVEVAKIAAANGAQQFLIVTAVGANPSSRVFYSRVKGNVEETISALKFKSTHFFQPSFLLGKRNESRAGERIGIAAASLLSPFLISGLRRYRAVDARIVAGAMVAVARQNIKGIHRYEFDSIQNIYNGAV